MAMVAAVGAGLDGGGYMRRKNSVNLILKTSEDEKPKDTSRVASFARSSSLARSNGLKPSSSTRTTDDQEEKLPQVFDRKQDRGVFKLCAGELWKPRILMMTTWDLLLGNPETEELLDLIPLHQISRVEKRRLEPEAAGPPTRLEKADKIVTPSQESEQELEGGNSTYFGRGYVKPNTRRHESFSEPHVTPNSATRRQNSMFSDQKRPEWTMKIDQVVDDEYNSACVHLLGFLTEEEIDVWLEAVRRAALVAAEAFKTRRRLLEVQYVGRQIYDSKVTQSLIALIIFANFVSDVFEVQKYGGNNQDKDSRMMFERLDLGFTSVFAVELVFNMMVHLSPTEHLRPFFRDGWNVFDFIIVGFSLVSLALPDITGVNTIRLLRGFRVFRLFGRFESMRRMIASLTASIIPVINALIVLLLIVSVYAVLGVKLFWHTPTRHFTTFVDSFLTMFQVVTYDNWSSEVLLPMSGDSDDVDLPAMLFLISFIIVVGWCVLPVVMAVLIDNFMDTKNRFRQKDKTQEKLGDEQLRRALDPLLEYLSYFETPEDLLKRIDTLFLTIDREKAGEINYEEFRDGIKRMQLNASSHLSRDDYDSITEHGALCNRKGTLGPQEFQQMMKRQLQLYVSRHANSWMTCGKNGNVTTMLFALKILMMQSPALDGGQQTSLSRSPSGESKSISISSSSLDSKKSAGGSPSKDSHILRTIVADQQQIMTDHRMLMSAVAKIAQKLDVQLDDNDTQFGDHVGESLPQGMGGQARKGSQNGIKRVPLSKPAASVATTSDGSSGDSTMAKDDGGSDISPDFNDIPETASVPGLQSVDQRNPVPLLGSSQGRPLTSIRTAAIHLSAATGYAEMAVPHTDSH